jgi:DNA invertase Pin-like site-specific DNA recombinase
MIAYSYLRFSTTEQKLGDSAKRQLESTRNYCERNGLDLDESKLLSDEGISAFRGANLKKGADLGDFLTDVQNGSISTPCALVIEHLDRISRQGIDATTDLLKQLTRASVEVHATQINLVLKAGFSDDLTNHMMVGAYAHIAKAQSEEKSKRIGSAWKGKKSRAADGLAITSLVPLWLKAEKGKVIQVIPERAATVKKIFQLAALGMGGVRIIQQLIKDGHKPFAFGKKKGHKWTRAYIQIILSSRTVLGEYQPHKLMNGKSVADGDPIPNFYPAIIEYSQWESARAVIDNKVTIGGIGDLSANLFTGIIKDQTANGRNMNFFNNGTNRPTALVTAYDSTDKTVHRFPYQRFEKSFLRFLEELDWKSVAGDTVSSEVKNLESQLSQISGEIDRTQTLINKRTAQMDDADLEPATVKVFANQIAKAHDKLVQLSTQRDELSKTIESSRKSAEALYSPQELLNLIQQNDKEVRLRLKAEIRKRITRIDLHFDATILTSTGKEIEHVTPGKAKVLANILFVNGIERMIVFQDDKAILLFLK